MAILGGIFEAVCENCGHTLEKQYFSFLKNGKIKKKCPSCKKYSLIKQEGKIFGEAPSYGGRFKNGRSMKERKERREKDFVKNVLPTLKGYDRHHFNKKYGKKS